MDNKFALVAAVLLIAFAGADTYWNGGLMLIELGRKLLQLITYVAVWR